MTQRLTGLVAAAYTPFHEDETLHLERIAPLTEHLINGRYKRGDADIDSLLRQA